MDEIKKGDIVVLLVDAISYGKGRHIYGKAGSKATVCSINHFPVIMVEGPNEHFHIHIDKVSITK